MQWIEQDIWFCTDKNIKPMTRCGTQNLTVMKMIYKVILETKHLSRLFPWSLSNATVAVA